MALTDEAIIRKLWDNIRQRCNNPNSPDFKRYGARGIRMHEPWRKSYEQFRNAILDEIGYRPTAKHSLDRIDNNKGYEPQNIRWATQKQQVTNSKTTFKHRELSDDQTLTQTAHLYGIDATSLRHHLEHGKSLTEAIHAIRQGMVFVPPRITKRYVASLAIQSHASFHALWLSIEEAPSQEQARDIVRAFLIKQQTARPPRKHTAHIEEYKRASWHVQREINGLIMELVTHNMHRLPGPAHDIETRRLETALKAANAELLHGAWKRQTPTDKRSAP